MSDPFVGKSQYLSLTLTLSLYLFFSHTLVNYNDLHMIKRLIVYAFNLCLDKRSQRYLRKSPNAHTRTCYNVYDCVCVRSAHTQSKCLHAANVAN